MKNLILFFFILSAMRLNSQCVVAYNLQTAPSTYNMQMQDSTLICFTFTGWPATTMRFIPLNFIPQMETNSGIQPIDPSMLVFGSTGQTGFLVDAMSLSCTNIQWQVRTYCFNPVDYDGLTWQDLEAAGVSYSDSPVQSYQVACPAYTAPAPIPIQYGHIKFLKPPKK